MSVSELFSDSGTQLKVLGAREFALRQDMEEQGRGELHEWTNVLELTLVIASAHEAIMRLGYRKAAEVMANIEKIDAIVETLCRLRPHDVIQANLDALAPHARLPMHADAPATSDTEEVIRTVKSLLLHVPDDELIPSGRAVRPELAHRCQLALDGLRAFVARHQHPDRTRFAFAGHAYADGRLSIDEVAGLLGAEVPDAVAHLEEQGFRRSSEGLRLEPEVRKARLLKIRADRLTRGGAPVLDPDLVRRDVIASQRIEDVDARTWLPR